MINYKKLLKCKNVRMDTQDGVVGLDNGGGNLGAAPDGERDLGLLAVVDGQALEQEAAETRASAATLDDTKENM